MSKQYKLLAISFNKLPTSPFTQYIPDNYLLKVDKAMAYARRDTSIALKNLGATRGDNLKYYIFNAENLYNISVGFATTLAKNEKIMLIRTPISNIPNIEFLTTTINSDQVGHSKEELKNAEVLNLQEIYKIAKMSEPDYNRWNNTPLEEKQWYKTFYTINLFTNFPNIYIDECTNDTLMISLDWTTLERIWHKQYLHRESI